MKAVFDDALKGVYRDVEAVAPSEETVDYKQIATLGVGSLVAAIVSILGFFWTPFILVAVVGVVLGVLGLRKIMRAPEEIGGFALTSAATALSVVLALSATCWRVYSFYHNAPPGYEIVAFDSLAFTKDGEVPPEIVALNGRRIYVDGYMYPTKRHAGITDFNLVRTLGHCQYCSPGTNAADMIAVSMERGHEVNYRANKLVGVGGVFYVQEDFRPGELPYSMKADVFR
jgi:hypothetical protein